MVRPVGRMLKVQDGGPVIGKVLGHLAGGAGTASTNIALHGGVEGIPTDDVVKMCRWCLPRLDHGVEALDGQSGAPEAETCLDRSDERQGGEGEGLHVCCLLVDGLGSTQGVANSDQVERVATQTPRREQAGLLSVCGSGHRLALAPLAERSGPEPHDRVVGGISNRV